MIVLSILLRLLRLLRFPILFSQHFASILHGNAGELGDYNELAVLPDKIARYLYEYHADSYASLGLPPLPVDRSKTDVHGILEPQEVIADHFYQQSKYLDYLAY